MKTLDELGISPAPWRVCKKWKKCQVMITDKNDDVITNVWNDFDDEDTDHDSNLIAAAPELYERLRETLDYVKAHKDSTVIGTIDRVIYDRIVGKGNIALIKAGGSDGNDK